MNHAKKAPLWFWITGAAALIWNAVGVLAYLQQALMSAEEFATLPEMEQNLMASQPVWVTAAFAIAVFAGLAAAVALLVRKRVAVRLFLLSLLAVIVQFSSYFVVDGYQDYMADKSWAMPMLILFLAISFAGLSWRAEQNGWLN